MSIMSGNTDLAARTGADIYVHEAGGAKYPHKALKHDDVIELGNIRIRALHTPGHTPESMTLLVGDTTRVEKPWMASLEDSHAGETWICQSGSHAAVFTSAHSNREKRTKNQICSK